jgi:AmiR/NasT family two-component response regulator
MEAHVGGCCAYLVKPLDRVKVIKEIETLGFDLER